LAASFKFRSDAVSLRHGKINFDAALTFTDQVKDVGRSG
jgi:hypothetical protein